MLISYAQNFEDVMLWRALKDVVNGFYIDIGANDPIEDSVSLAFYQRGWRGIHVEPVHEFAERIRLARPDEEVIEAAIASRRKSLTLYKVGDTGMSTGDAAIAAQHEAAGFPVESRVVPCLALSKILSRFEDRDIHWLKIDVEGMEKSVIDSWLPSTARPWIVVVESTEPNSPKQNFEEWEPALLDLGYEFIYFDGLNRFYVSAAQPQLKAAFGPGPNYFDDFSLTETSMFTRLLAVKQQESERNIADLDSKLAAHERRAAETQRAISARDRKIAGLNDELASQEHIAAQAQGALGARDRDVADLNDKLASQVQIAAEAQLAINARDHEIADLNDKLALQERRAAEAQRAVSGRDRDIAELNNKLASQERRVAEAQRSVAARDRDIAKLNNDLASQERAAAARDRDIANLNNDLASQERAAAARDRDIANLKNDLASQERAAAAKDRDIANLSNDLTSQESRIAEAQRALGASDREIASLNDRLISQGHMTAEVRRELDLAREQIANLHSQIDALNNALSGSAFPTMRNARSAYVHLRHGVWAWLTFAPRSRPRRVVRKILAEASRSSALKAVARVFFAPFPELKNRLRVAIENDRYLKLEAERLGDAGKREARVDNRQQAVAEQSTDRTFTFDATVAQTTFLFVGHTATCQTNTGVQRTVRGLATGLAANGVRVRYVKWDATSKQCVLIDSEERAHLSKWNGPNFGDEEKDIYIFPGQPAAALEDGAAVNARLIVPEVVHASFQDHVVAIDLIMWARNRGIEIGFIFYDAIPLLRAEFAEIVPAHAQYMQHLRLADVIWPISRWSGRDLISFWSTSERAGPKTMPPVLPLHLPAGSASQQRHAGVRHQEDLILSVGTIEERKNQLQLIRAFQAHMESNPQSSWRLVLVGNLHPNVATEVQNAASSDSSIRHLGHVSDEELEGLYSACAFTVFPSVEEGFGLPILESLAHGKPCVCANFGAMAELIEGGGCLPVDTRDLASVRGAMEELMTNLPLRQSLTEQACSRSIISWSDYAASISGLIGSSARSRAKLGFIYYRVDLTASFPNNTGIQEVTRQLARQLMSLGFCLIPVKWDRTSGAFGRVNKHELTFLSSRDGPSPEQWNDWIAPEVAGANSWLVMTELPLNLTADEPADVRRYAKERNLQHAAVFYGAVHDEMKRNCSESFLQAHREYMLSLASYDLVLASSDSSRAELIKFLGRELIKPQSLEMQIETVALSQELSNDPHASQAWTVYADRFADRLACHSHSDQHAGLSVSPDDVQQRSLAMKIPPRPKLSLCISTYNRAEWLSINLKNWARLYPTAMSEVELLVCDNASADHTEEIVRPYLQRSDFTYLRNPQNVGMLGNLRVAANHARGSYIWTVGDDDLLMPGSIERVLKTIDENPDAALVYLNYAFTRIDDARTVTNFEAFFAEATPVVPAEPDRAGPLREICAENENFFTAIYTLVFRRDHAINAYSQNTNGRPFSTMLTAIPTTHYVLNHIMEEQGVWIGSPQIVVNMNVSWKKYTPLWILERIPEVYELAERKGAANDDIDRWRRHTLPGIFHYFREIYRSDPLNNAVYFSPARLVRRFKHLPEFSRRQSELVSIYEKAHKKGHPAAREPTSEIFPSRNA
jgi:FkbM family methyltransferase